MILQLQIFVCESNKVIPLCKMHSLRRPHLFNMQEVFGLKCHTMSRHGHIVIVCRSVGVICTHSKRNGFVLQRQRKTRDATLKASYGLFT